MFLCFAPRENPRIAMAVVVENSGYGNTWAAPIAGIIMEKYLNDTLRPERYEQIERIANSNLMPPYLHRLQYIEDSTRARRWFEMTKDSSYIKKYIFGRYTEPKRQEPPKSTAIRKPEAVAPPKANAVTDSTQ